MRILLVILVTLLLHSCAAQRHSTGVLKGRVDIGPLCPQEPCNPSPERLKQIYSSYEVVVTDTAARKILVRIPIQPDATFSKSVSPGQYLALIKPTSGSGFRHEPTRITIAKGKTTDIILSYDTGLR